MRYLMLMRADADAASGDKNDFQAWADFDKQVRTAGAWASFVCLIATEWFRL
jgi:hypothetical protein